MKYRLLTKLYPKKIKENYENLVRAVNIKIDASQFIGFILIFGWGLAVATSLFLAAFGLSFWLTFAIAFIGIELFVYFWFLLKVDAKIKSIEKNLPDALQLMASNLRAGLTVDRALLLASRPEFGPLKDEINLVGKEITIGKDITEALLNITKRIKSEKLEKTIMLIVSGLNSGGQLALLLEQTSRNLRNEDLVDQKVRSNVKMYVIFIFSAISFGAPLLFALSSFLVEVLTKIVAEVEIPKATGMNIPLGLTKVSVSSNFIIAYVLVSLAATSIMGSLVLGLINKGREKDGLRFIPILIVLTFLIFFLVRYLLFNLAGGLFNI